MRRSSGALLAFVLVLLCATAEAMPPRDLVSGGHVRVRVRSEPEGSVLVGQQTRLIVEILTDTWFTEAPRYPELVLDGAISLMPDAFGTNFTERIEGTTFAAQSRSYVIFPQRPGPLEIPSIRIRLGVATDGATPSEPFTLRTRPLKLNVMLPAEAEGVEGLVTTPRLRVRERFDRPLEGLAVGDAFERVIEIEAARSLGMLLPELTFEAPRGLAVYPGSPKISDSVNRGVYEGRRIERATYVLQEAGRFTLPSIDVRWWDPRSGSLATSTLEGASFEVGDAAGAERRVVESSSSATAWRRRIERSLLWAQENGITLLVLGLTGLALFRTGRRLIPVWIDRAREEARRRRASEAQAFKKLERSLRRRDADAVVESYWRWRDRFYAETGKSVPSNGSEAEALSTAWAPLARARYAEEAGEVDWKQLHARLKAFRRAARAAAGPSEAPFGALNPRAG